MYNDSNAVESFETYESALSAAEQGNADAMYRLAQMFDGECVFKPDSSDYEQSYKWYRKAAEYGNIPAAEWLINYKHELIPEWFLKAAERGDAHAQYLWGKSLMHTVDVEVNEAEVVKWLQKAADQNHAYAQYYLGRMYSDGRGTSQNYAAALELFKKAADAGLSEAYAAVGSMYESGEGVPQDYKEAASWYGEGLIKDLGDSGPWLSEWELY